MVCFNSLLNNFADKNSVLMNTPPSYSEQNGLAPQEEGIFCDLY